MIKIKQKIAKFNDYIADKMSLGLSVMTTFYIILLLVLFPLLYQQPIGLVGWASYLCTVIFQGIALPVLGYTSRIAGNKTDILMNKILEHEETIQKLVEIIEKQNETIEKHFGIDEKENI